LIIIFDLFDAFIPPSITFLNTPIGEFNMRIAIQARGFDLTEALRKHTERRLQFALSWAAHGVRTVTVRLSDINGPRGGNDKRCSIQIPIPGGQDVVVEDVEADFYAAIDCAAGRTERAVARRFERLREHHHERLDNEEMTDLSFDAAKTQNAVSAST
jgi:putative sigma-54 modulation protein